jgi:hypothetical protein
MKRLHEDAPDPFGKVTPVGVRRVRSNDARAYRMSAPAGVSAMLAQHLSLDPEWTEQIVVPDARGMLKVSHRLSLGPCPRASICWQCESRWYDAGYRVEVLVTQAGFPSLATTNPIDKINCGLCVVSSHQNDEAVIDLQEGDSFFTVRLISGHPTGLIGRSVAKLRERWTDSPVRVPTYVMFRLAVSSGKLAVERVELHSRLVDSARRNAAHREALGDEVGELDPAYPLNKHTERVRRETDERVATMRAIIESCNQSREKIISDPTLSEHERSRQLRMLAKLETYRLREHQCPAVDDDVDVDAAE